MQRLPDADLFPPFSGFPKEGIQFFKKLKKNNRRDWFEKHKGEYEEFVKLPMQSLIVSLRAHFESFAPEFDLHPKRSLFRIYRDVRFSKDKSPYKTHVAAHIVLRGKPKGFEGSGYYLHIEPGEIFLGGGIYMPDGMQVKKIRKAISERSDEFLRIVRDKPFVRLFGKIDGASLQRVPQGYAPDHPMADYLKLKQFFVGVEWNDSKCFTASFAKEASQVFQQATPLVRFLNEAIAR